MYIWISNKIIRIVGGRVNLVYSILFGLISLVSYKLILHPVINMFIELKITSLIISLLFHDIAVYRM